MAKNEKKSEPVSVPKDEPREATPAPAVEVQVQSPSTALTVVAGVSVDLAQIPAEYRDGVERLMTLMNPSREGIDETVDYRWRPSVLKIRHGMTKNAPTAANIGDIYSDEGEVLKQPFRFTPLNIYATHIKFSGEGGDGKIDCSSDDTKMSRNGATLCAECEFRPFKDGKPNLCTKVMHVVGAAVDEDKNIDIVNIDFSKSNYTAGANLAKMVVKSVHIWEKWFHLITKVIKGKKGEYPVYDIKATGDKVDPALRDGVLYPLGEIIRRTRAAYLEELRGRRSAAGEMVEALDARGSVDADVPDFSDGGL